VIRKRLGGRKRAGGGAGPQPPVTITNPTFVISETERRSEAVILQMLLQDQARRGDSLVFTPQFPETERRGDALIVTASAQLADTERRAALASFITAIAAVSRSGTPDSDMWGDGWTNAALGQTAINHGNETPLIVGANALGERRGYVKVDLRKFSGLTATGNAHTIMCRVTNTNGLMAQTLRLRAGSNGNTNPFTESTLAQNNQPAIPTTVDKSGNVNAGATTTLVFTLTDSEMNALLGNWVLMALTTTGLSDMQVISREGLAADRMTINFTARV
jgi:hypothetical protein